MRKELILAIFAGCLLGVGVAFGVWRLNSAIRNKPGNTNVVEEIVESESTFALKIAKPDNFTVLTANPAEISGITKKASLLAIISQEIDYFNIADAEGAFLEEVELEAGINEISVFSFDPENGLAKEDLTLVFSSAFEEESEAETLEEKIQEKLDSASHRAVAYIGTVTDISEETIQIKDRDGEILQVAINSEVDFVNSTTTTTKAVEFEDVAIGDFIIAMGYINGQEVLDAQRIVITTAPSETKKEAVLADVVKRDNQDFVVRNRQSNEEIIIETDRQTVFSTFDEEGQFAKSSLSQVEEGSLLILVGTISDNTLSARSIHLLP